MLVGRALTGLATLPPLQRPWLGLSLRPQRTLSADDGVYAEPATNTLRWAHRGGEARCQA
jgi:hypothetical protein